MTEDECKEMQREYDIQNHALDSLVDRHMSQSEQTIGGLVTLKTLLNSSEEIETLLPLSERNQP